MLCWSKAPQHKPHDHTKVSFYWWEVKDFRGWETTAFSLKRFPTIRQISQCECEGSKNLFVTSKKDLLQGCTILSGCRRYPLILVFKLIRRISAWTLISSDKITGCCFLDLTPESAPCFTCSLQTDFMFIYFVTCKTGLICPDCWFCSDCLRESIIQFEVVSYIFYLKATVINK